MEVSDLAERIIHDINVALSREPNMDEFDIIPVLDSQNKSPVVHVGTKMALESWCVKFLYVHVYTRLMEWRERRLKADDQNVAQWSELLLLLNPDVSTGWNIRKELLIRNKRIQSNELRLSKLILTRKPKSPEVFIHRRWLIRRLLQSEDWLNSAQSVKEQLVLGDLQLCTESAMRYPNNYCAWCHREWIHDSVTLKYLSVQVLLDELKFSENYVQRNVSDHSGFQFRQYLLKTLCRGFVTGRVDCGGTTTDNKVGGERRSCDDFAAEPSAQFSDPSVAHRHHHQAQTRLHDELSFVHRLIFDFPGHEALWYHSRFVLDLLSARVSVEPVVSGDRDNEGDTATALNGPLVKKTRTESGANVLLLQDELNFVTEMQADDVQRRLAVNHKHWLALRFALDNA